MMVSNRHSVRNTLAVTAAVGACGLAAAALAGNPNPGVAPVNSSAYGHSYGGWSAEWWKWFLSIPTPDHPGIGGDCGEGQSGQVFFLAADFTGGGLSCTIPAGKAILLAMVNVECSTVEAPPFFGADEEELRACAKCFADQIVVSSLEASLDGEALGDLGSYRAASPLFSFDYPADNIFGIPGGPATGDSVSDGYWLLLNPLPAGNHTLTFGGAFDFPEGECGLDAGTAFGFALVYELTVGGN